MNLTNIIFGLVLFSISSCMGEKEEVKQEEQKQLSVQEKVVENPQSDKKTVSQNINRSFFVEKDDIVLGDAKSKIVLLEYFSPTCPHCVMYHKIIFPELREKYIDNGKIAYIMREFITNKQDLDASLLARCKGDISNYLKFVNVILSKQNDWAYNTNYREILTNIGGLGGVSPQEYANCLGDKSKVNVLVNNTKHAMSIGDFPGTPTFFINGKQFKEKYTAEELSKAIEQEILALNEKDRQNSTKDKANQNPEQAK